MFRLLFLLICEWYWEFGLICGLFMVIGDFWFGVVGYILVGKNFSFESWVIFFLMEYGMCCILKCDDVDFIVFYGK